MANAHFALTDYEVLHTLGRGSFGRVRLARKKADQSFYAMKVLKKAMCINSKQVDHVFSEFRILAQLQHPFIVGSYGLAQDSRYLYLLLEYIRGGELFRYIRSRPPLDNSHARFYAGQVVLIFEYLHSLSVVYRDLKPENLLLAADGYLKLTDFGFAKLIQGRTYTLCGTPEYLSPEVLLNKGHSKPADWWTFGILVYELLVGIDPFSADSPMEVYQNILHKKPRFPPYVDPAAKSLIRHLLVADLSKRYGCLKNGVHDIKFHTWFSGFDWVQLVTKQLPAPYVPPELSDFRSEGKYPDSPALSPALVPEADPFLTW